MRMLVALLSMFCAIPLVLGQDEMSAVDIVEQSMPSIVTIRAETPSGIFLGTGFIVDPSGVIVTNLHVIRGAQRAAIILHTGEQFPNVMVSAYDETRDIVLLRILGFDLRALKLADSNNVKVGQTVYAIGNPLGLAPSVRSGIVSSIRTGDDGTKFIQTDSAVSLGNSGGPLIGRNGEVVGVVTLKVTGRENLNFAIPINYVRALLWFETLVTLEEFADKLSKKEVSLFAHANSKSSQPLSGSWMSLTSTTANRIQLQQDGGRVYGNLQGDGTRATLDCELTPTKKYECTARFKVEGQYWDFWSSGWKDAECMIVTELEIHEYSDSRIEGQLFWPTVEFTTKKVERSWWKTCGASVDRKWGDFVWVIQE